MAEEQNEQKQIEQLAENVADRVIQREPYEATMRAFILSIRADVKEVALEVFLRFRGVLLGKRDKEWAGIIASAYVAEGTEVPSNPYELREMILRWKERSEKAIAKAKQSEGYNAGFSVGLNKGVRHGWGAAQAGEGLEKTIQVAEKMQP